MLTGDWLRSSRELLGLSQTDLRKILNSALNRAYDKSRISRWENNKENIPIEIKKQIQILLDLREKRAKIIAFSNQKGGVGKTTSALNTASALKKMGKRVLLIDLDPQASATDWILGINGLFFFKEEISIYHCLIKDKAISECIIKNENSLSKIDFDFISSHINLSEADSRREPGFEHILLEKIEEVINEYEFIIIDSPPNLGLMTYMALVAADTVIIPVQTEPPDAMGVALLLNTIQKIQRRLNPKLKVGGILPTRYNHRQAVDREVLKQLIEATANKAIVLEPVPESSVFGNAAWTGSIAIDTSPKSKAISSYISLSIALATNSPLPMALLHRYDDTHINKKDI